MSQEHPPMNPLNEHSSEEALPMHNVVVTGELAPRRGTTGVSIVKGRG